VSNWVSKLLYIAHYRREPPVR